MALIRIRTEVIERTWYDWAWRVAACVRRECAMIRECLFAGQIPEVPRLYCPRATLKEPNNQALWQIYSMLTNLEAVFRSLKTDFGLRPVYHHNGDRVEGHLFISILDYYIVHTLRRQLEASGINDSWETLRGTLSTQVRITATPQRRDGRTIHVRKASRPELEHRHIYSARKLSANPGGTQQTLV